MEEFSVLRIEALIMCCVRAPACIADYLCYQFYEENYTVVTRLDILEVLIGAARQLSIVKQDEKKEIEEVQRKEWEIEVMERVKNKTRYFNTPTKVVFGKENKFNKVCCHFFYALMAQYDKDIKTLSLGDEDSLLLGRLIYTLGIILHCAMSSPSAPLMSKSLLDFIKVFTAPRFAYLDDYIKQSILFSAGIIAHSATSSPELFIMLAPLRGWADDILTESSCYETSKLALHAINIMDNVIYNDIQIPQPESVSNEKAIFNVLQECSKVDITQLDQIQAQLESISLVKEKLNIH